MKHLFTLSEWLRAKWERLATLASSAMQSLKATKRQSDTTIFAERVQSTKSIFANRGVKDVRVSLGQYPTDYQRISNLYLTPNRFFTRFAAVFTLVFVLGVSNVWGANPDPVLCTFPSSGSITNNSITVNSVTWSIETTVGEGSPSVALTNATYASTSKSSIKFGSSKKIYYSSFSLSTNYFSSYNVSAVNVHYALNGGATTTVTATQGNTTIGSDTYSTGQTWHDATMNTSKGTGGELTISFTTTQAIAIHSIEITYTAAASGHSITYHCNGATSGCPSNASGQTKLPATLPTPSKTGCIFAGWYTNEGLTTAAVAGATLSADANLYAKWTTNVTLNRNGATETINNVAVGTALNDIDGTGAQGGCSAWTFVGWSKTQRAAQNVSTEMTLVTEVDGSGPYYAVYSHTESGGGSSDVVWTASEQGWSNDTPATDKTVSGVTVGNWSKGSNSNAPKYYTSGTAVRAYGGNTFNVSSTSTITKIVLGFGSSDGSNTISTNVDTYSNGTWTGSATSVTFTIGGSSGNRRISSITTTITGGSTTYYSTTATCCTSLAQINGSVNLTQNSAVLTWDNLEGVAASNPYAVTYRKGSEDYGSANVGEITTNAQGKKTCTITGLECGTEYDFKIAVTGDGSHCDAEEVLENKSTTKWNITYNLTNTVDLLEGPAQGANACGEIIASFTKDGLYTFPEEITVTIGGNAATVDVDYLWDDSKGELYIEAAKVTGDVVIMIAGVAPLNPIVTPSPSALSFAQVKKGAAVPAAQDIAITGHNLTAALTVTSSNPSLYAVSVKSESLTPDGNKDASPVITVTPQAGITSTAGDKNATITISGGGLASNVVVNVTFNVQETYTVNWYVNGTKIDANSKTDVEGTAVTAPTYPDDFSEFTDCLSGLHFVGWATSEITGNAGTTIEPGLVTPISAIGTTATTNYYAVFAEGTPGGTPKLFEETFAESNGSSGWSGNGIASGNSVAYDNEGWSADKAYGNGGSVRFGTSSAQGYALTPEIDVDGSATLTFKSGAWAGDKTEDGLVLTVEKGAATLTPATLTLTDSEWHANEVAITGAEGPIKIKFSAAQASKNRFFLDDVVVSQTSAPVYTKWYTTCPHVARVTLSAASVENGSISFEQSGSAVTNVRTDGGADVDVDVVPDPATGYELTGVALSGVAGASYDAGVITIPQDAEGTLTVTATFSKKNYTVTMAQTGGASAEISDDQSNKHYEDVITVTAEDKAGFIFAGWTASPAVTFANAKALETTFSMPNGNVTVTAAYAKVYTPAEALALDDLTDSVYVEGVISQVDEVSTQYKNATYWISADGTTTNQIKIYRGKHINKADVTVDNAAQIAVGNKVRVRGKLSQSSNVNQFGQGASYITVLVEKTLSALTIAGDASVTTYDVGDSFDNTGLSVTATYNTGYVVTNYDATITSDYDAPTTFTAGVTSVTVSASEGLINTERVIPVTVSSAVLDHAELAAGVQTEFWAKESYKEPLLNAYLNDEPATVLANVTGVTDVSGLDMSVAGDKHVTITYTRKAVQTTTVGYDFTVKPVVVDEAHAHSVSTAREIIDVDKTDGEDLDLDLEGTKTHVVGVVTSVNALTGSNAGKYTIVIKDQTDANKVMTLYQVTLKSGITSVAEDDLIKAYGNLYYHTNSSKYEINTDGEVVAVVRTPNLTVADVDEMEVNFTADLAEADLTIDRDGSEGAITFSCSDPAVTIVNNKLHAAAEGNATVTATMEANGIYTEASTTFNVHVIAARTRYTVTFDANGADGGSAPEAIANQLEGAPVDLPECTYTWAHHGFTGWKVINLSTSAEIEIENNQFTMPAANVKIQAQWEEIATTHIVFNVNGNTETVEAVDVPQAVEYSITQVTDGQNGYEFFGWAESEQAEDVEEAIATIERYTPEAGEASKTLYAVFKRVDEGAPKTDVLTAADLKATDTQYKDFSNVSKTSNAKYAGNSAKDSNGNIQLRSNNSNSGIVSTTSGGILKSVKINVASGSNTIDVYGSNTAYNAASDLYATGNNANQGTKIGSTSSTATINAEADYKFVGIRSNNGAIYLSSVEIVWQPKTTYYTTAPSAVYAVSYDLGEGAWAGEACDGANVKAGQTFDICESVPVREHYKFNGWTAGGNVVSGTITINAETAITAVWEPKVENDITYNAGTGSGSDAVVGNNEEGAEIVLPSAADKSLSKEGYDFVGWLYGGDLYEAGTTFEMPASAVTFVAQWKKQNVVKMSLITDASQLMNGMEVIFGYIDENDADKNAVNGDITGTNKFFTSVTSNVTFNNDNTVTFGSGAMVLTIEKADGGWKLRKNATNYLTNSGDNLSWNSKGNATTWTISFEDNNAKIATGSVWIQYNSSSPRFKTYSSTQKAIQLYGKAVVVSENVNISDLGYVEGDVIVVSSGATLTMDAPSAPASITVKENAVVNVSAATEAGTVIVEKGAKLAIEEGGSVTTDEPLVLYTTLGKGTGTNTSGNAPGSSSEIINAERLNATGDVYLEIELTQDAKASAGWYAFSVPFPVDAMNGVYYGDTKLTNEVGYAIMSHYGELRAKDEYAWKKFRGIMQPGVFYVITVGNTDYKTLRFKKVADESLVASSSVAVSPFPTQTGNNADGAWNGIGNPNLAISNLSTAVTLMQFYDHKTNTFIGRNHSVNLVVGSAFFIQYNGGETVSIPVGTTDYEGVLAPRREQKAVEEMIYEVQLTNVATGELEDNVFLTAREDAKNEYEIGRDVAKLSMGTAKCAQMWVPAYGTKLCAADFQLVNDKAEYPLTLNAPSAGTYSISMMENDAATIYLTYEGNIIWNLSESAYPIDMKKGTTEGYGLLLNAKMPMTPTGVETIDNSQFTIHNCQKVIIDEHVYILRGGQMYDVTGKAVK